MCYALYVWDKLSMAQNLHLLWGLIKYCCPFGHSLRFVLERPCCIVYGAKLNEVGKISPPKKKVFYFVSMMGPGRALRCLFSCLTMWSERTKRWPQYLHSNFFSPVWARR